MPRGIKHCYWVTNGTRYLVEKGKTYYLYSGDTNEFVVDETCMEDGTVNKKSSAQAARWAYIYNDFLPDVEKLESGASDLWGPLGTGPEPVGKWGVGTRYKVGSSVNFSPSGHGYYFGYKQRIEVFSFSPGTGFFFYVVPVAESKIDFAYFSESERVRRYGEMMQLQLMFHGYNLEKNNKYRAKLYLLEVEKAAGLGETSEFESNNVWDTVKTFDITTTSPGSSNFNCRFIHNFPIEIDWREGENRQKNFTVAVEIYKKHMNRNGTEDPDKAERVAYRNFATEPTKDLVNYDRNLLQLQDIDQKDSTSSRFMVSGELMADYLRRTEQTRQNQIQYIGDIRYTHKDFDPCGYSKITIKDASASDRSPFVAFDEDSLQSGGDRTELAFEIIRGEEKKAVSITAENLQNKGVPCTGVLLEPGQKHDQPAHVFLTDRVRAALHSERGYVTANDPSQAGDTDVVADPNKAPSEDVSEVQNLSFSYKGENEVNLDLNYMYSKVFMERSLGSNAASEFLWMFNYFWLGDDLGQTWYLPVSTCRYPNQIARIRVFPDIEWEFNLKLSSEVPEVYSHTNMPAGVSSRQNRNRTLQATNNRRFLNAEVSFELAIKGKTGEHQREIGGGYAAKIEPFLRALVKVKETLDEITGVTAARRGMAASVASRVRLVNSPITFQMDYPVISIAGTWKLEPDKEKPNKVRRTGTVSVGFTPLIKGTGKLDLIACAEFIPAAGQVIKAIRTAADFAGIEIWFNLYAFGQIDLKTTINLGQEYGADPIEVGTTVGIGAELGVKAAANVPKISFRADSASDVSVEFEASARGETSLMFSAKRGMSNEGLYIEAGVGFGGLLVFVTAKAKVWRAKIGVDNEAHELVAPRPDMLKGRYYYVKN
ncbi:hypothetical protein [Pedobacter sp. SYP-B3415]|uniref:hypothetical protein n=1 Tax=Pedobacter sp. SYP-B3415 TaxID=2496641 RepID=UPI00101D2445|nr:hypothetical protein [Pedobacter sp. SYP-B3415]